MNNNTKIVSAALAGILIGGITVVGANQAIQAIQNTNIKVSLNGQVQEFKDETTGETQYPITYNDRTYLPLRNIAQLVGLDVDYDVDQNMALLKTITNDVKSIYPSQTFDLNHLVYTLEDEGEPIDKYYMEEGYGDFIWSGLISNCSASSTLKENGTEYVASNLNSFANTDTCWAEGARGSGIGETITIASFGSCDKVEWRGKDYTNHDDVIEYLLNEYNSDPGRIDKTQITKDNINNYHNVVKRIAIINGYAKNDETWKNNNRVKKLKLTINGEKEYILNLNDTKDMQVFEVDYQCEITKKITCTFEILEVYKGTKYDDTCITAIDVDGDADVIWGGR